MGLPPFRTRNYRRRGRAGFLTRVVTPEIRLAHIGRYSESTNNWPHGSSLHMVLSRDCTAIAQHACNHSRGISLAFTNGVERCFFNLSIELPLFALHCTPYYRIGTSNASLVNQRNDHEQREISLCFCPSFPALFLAIPGHAHFKVGKLRRFRAHWHNRTSVLRSPSFAVFLFFFFFSA